MSKPSHTIPSRKHAISFANSPSMTKQSFKEECNINAIMAKFQRTGILAHYAAHAPTYQDIPALDYLDALSVISRAESMFEELPSSIRAKFNNSPEEFLEFVQNPDNLAEMAELGLAKPPSLSNMDLDAKQSVNASASSEDKKIDEVKDDQQK